MTHPNAGQSLKEIKAQDGVNDLPLMVGGKFAMALRAEAVGDYEKAAKYLEDAVEAE